MLDSHYYKVKFGHFSLIATNRCLVANRIPQVYPLVSTQVCFVGSEPYWNPAGLSSGSFGFELHQKIPPIHLVLQPDSPWANPAEERIIGQASFLQKTQRSPGQAGGIKNAPILVAG